MANFSDPCYTILSRINGKINNMTIEELKKNLKSFQLNANGTKEILKRRLKEYYKNTQVKCGDSSVKRKSPRYYIVVDFEATCEENNENYEHEIIEFPSILVDAESNTIIDEFHSYVQPIFNPKLSLFCTKLTGITQEMVDESPIFSEVFMRWQNWLADKKLKFAIVTDGPWDMDKFLWTQCCKSRIKMPKYCQRWVNIRKLFASVYKSQRTNIAGMLEALSLQFEGTPHCGLHDSRNIARILVVMLQDGIIPQINENLRVGHKHLLDTIVSSESAQNIIKKNVTNDNQYEEDCAGSTQRSDYWDREDKDISDLLLYVSLQSN